MKARIDFVANSDGVKCVQVPTSLFITILMQAGYTPETIAIDLHDGSGPKTLAQIHEEQCNQPHNPEYN